MSSDKEFNYSSLQSKLQSAEKKFQSDAYDLSIDVQKANKAYQKSLNTVDKAYKSAEKAHAQSLRDIAKKYAEQTKALTEKGIKETKNKEATKQTAKQRWTDQQKVIKEGFKDALGNKKDELENIEAKKKAQEKALNDDYQKAKQKLQSVKTQTTEIFLNAQEPFNKSLNYYMRRLADGAKDDQKYLKQELAALRKDLTAIERKEDGLLKAFAKETSDHTQDMHSQIEDYSKSITAIAAKIKASFTRSTKKYDEMIDGFNDVIKAGVKSNKVIEKKIETAIETMNAEEKAFIKNPPVDLDTRTLNIIAKELSTSNEIRHNAYQEVYQSLFRFMSDLTSYVRDIRDSYRSTVHTLMNDHLAVYSDLIDESTLVSEHRGWWDAPEAPVHHMRIGPSKNAILEHVEHALQPFIDMQKKWHAKLLKAYKEFKGIYDELDEIQSFFDSFDEEKALAFENEQVHITKKSSQLNIEIETAKKRYEVDMLEAEQSVLFAEKKRDYLEKVARAEKQLAAARFKAELDQKKKASQKVIDEAKTDYKLKKAYHDVEKSLLDDKRKYVISREHERFELKRLENEKAKENAIYAMNVQQNSELDAHDSSILQAENKLAQHQEEKHQVTLNFEQKHAENKQNTIFELKKERDEYELEIRRLDFEEDTELRDIEKFKNDEIMVPKNRLKEFDRALKRRYESINKPYKSLLKKFDKLASTIDDPDGSYEKVIAVASPEFKDAINMTLESDYETLRWTREYYSELEISRIKRNGLSTRKQTTEIRRHEQSEEKYLESLETYLKSSQQKVNSIFERFTQKITNQTIDKPKNLIRVAQQLHEEALKLVEEQTQSVLNEIQSLFDYIRVQDQEFIEEIKHGAESAVATIQTKYAEMRQDSEAQVALINTRIQAERNTSIKIYSDAELEELAKYDVEIEALERNLERLNNERSMKLERFKADVQGIESEHHRIADNIQLEEDRRIEDINAEFDLEAERITAKLEQAKLVLTSIQTTEKQTSDYYKQVYDHQVANAERTSSEKVRKLEDQITEAKREMARKKIEIERLLNRTIDTIQKEISSKETQLEAGLEKVTREYDTLYFDKQTRMQHLNERTDILRKQLLRSKQELLDGLESDLTNLPPLLELLPIETAVAEEQKALDAHRDQITMWIADKKRAFQENL